LVAHHRRSSNSVTGDFLIGENILGLASGLSRTSNPPGNMSVNGLKVFVDSNTAEKNDNSGVFYSRRENGPYYRWSYETKAKNWRVTRVSASDSFARLLSAASWKGVPAALQKNMIEHYQD